MFIFLPNIILIAAAFLILGLPTLRLRRRLNSASTRLADTTVDRGIQEKFSFVLKDSAKKARTTFWLGLAVFCTVSLIGFQAYASSVESNANVIEWLLIYLVVLGFGLLVVALILSEAVAVHWQAYQAAKVLREYVTSYPSSPVLEEVRAMVGPRVGDVGVSVVTIVIVVACTVYGLLLIALLYMATQTAIDCARSSKCM